MTVLKFHGEVQDIDRKSIGIGGRNVIREIQEAFPAAGRVTVTLADETFTGDLEAWEGMRGYSEWTPGELPQLMVGEHDIWDRLDDMLGETVTLWISDEPVNTLEEQ